MEDHTALLEEIRDELQEQININGAAGRVIKKINAVIEPEEWTVEKVLNPHIFRWSDNSLADTLGWMTKEEAMEHLRNLRSHWVDNEGEEPFFYSLRKKDR